MDYQDEYYQKVERESCVPKIKRLAKERKGEEMDIAIFHYRRLTSTNENIIKMKKNIKFLKYFEYIN